MRIVVVGSGVSGASVAFHANRMGAETVLVDRSADGQATAAGAGIVCPWLSRINDPAWYQLARAGALYYPELVQALADAGETDLGYRRVGALRIADDSAELDRTYDHLISVRADTPDVGDVSRLSGSAARELFPPLRADVDAVHVSGAARVDGRRLRDALVSVAVREGSTVRHGTAELVSSADRITGVGVDGERIEADAVVVAAGAWTADLLAPLGFRAPSRPERGQIVHLGLTGVDTSRWPVVLPDTGHYLLAFDDARVVVGATRETGAGFDYRVTAAGLAEVLNQALTVAPGLADATYLETRVGFRPVGPDVRPSLGTVSGLAGLVVLTGLGTTGLTMGPNAGRIAASLALDESVDLDLAPYDPLRTDPATA